MSSILSHRRRFLLIASPPALMALGVLTLYLRSSTTPNPTLPPLNSPGSAKAHFPLEISPDPIELGVLDPGESAEATLLLRNPRAEPILVVKIETSCDCVSAKPGSLQFGGCETRTLTLSYDPSAAPIFEGRLGVVITGYMSGDNVAFRTGIRLRVGHGED